jgi:Alkylmercury lyase
VIDQWCPLVNFFDDERAAQEWASERGVSGRSFGIDAATELGASLWRPLIGASDARS